MTRPGRCSLILLALLLAATAWGETPLTAPDRASALRQLATAEARLSAIAEVPPGSSEAERKMWADLHMELVGVEHLEARYQSGGKRLDLPGDSGWPALYWKEVEKNRALVRSTARKAAHRVGEMRRLLSGNPRPVSPELARMQDILQRSRFVNAKPTEPRMVALMRKLGEMLGKIFHAQFLEATWVGTLATFILATVLAVLAGVVLWFGVIRRFHHRKSRRRGEAPPEEVAPPPRPVELRRMAEEALAAGRAREALHFHYLALVVSLSELELVPFSSGRTNREIVRYLRRRQAPREAVRRIEGITSRYDLVWYGSGECDRSEVQTAAGEIDQALAELTA